MRNLIISVLLLSIYGCSPSFSSIKSHPNIILIMTDDQGWGQTGYNNHPVLDTPNLDAMSENGLRFDRFYAGSPVCSPTRASVLTGRSNDRTGVLSWGYALRTQEKTIASALKRVGYSTGHFGKWHLNGLSGPGVPIFKNDSHNPSKFGFDQWLSVSNFFDINPLMSENGVFVDLEGSSSEIIINKALKFIEEKSNQNKPFFTVIWDGSPHIPFMASKSDIEKFKNLDERSQLHYAELAAFDRSIGVLRDKLRKLDLAKNTIIWYCSDNGGLTEIYPETVGGLRGSKNTIWEGGIRVPGIIEWPSVIKPKVTKYPVSTMDIFPTIADIVGLDENDFIFPVDGVSIRPIFENEIKKRDKRIPFRYKNQGALIDNDFKLIATSISEEKFELYNLRTDPSETQNISTEKPRLFTTMKEEFLIWNQSVDSSFAGLDYKEKKVLKNPESHYWNIDNRYEPFFKEWIKRPEYREQILKISKGRN